MTTAASGGITKAEERIRDMLAGCKTFQTWTGESDAAGAKTHIYYDAVPLPNMKDDSTSLAYLVSLRPFALIWTSETSGYAYNELMGGSGIIHIRFEGNTPPATSTDWEECDRLFKIKIGNIIQSTDSSNPGLAELSKTGTYTQITSITLDALYRSDEEEWPTYGDAQRAEVSVQWGVTR